mgnify:CR=1 FL=1
MSGSEHGSTLTSSVVAGVREAISAAALEHRLAADRPQPPVTFGAFGKYQHLTQRFMPWELLWFRGSASQPLTRGSASEMGRQSRQDSAVPGGAWEREKPEVLKHETVLAPSRNA